MEQINNNYRPLEELSDAELKALEDGLLLKRELASNLRSPVAAGRIAVAALTIVYSMLFLFLFSLPKGLWARLAGNPVVILVYLIPFGLGITVAVGTWNIIGCRGRFFVRGVMHYWPVTVYAIAQLVWVIKIIAGK